MKAMFCGCRAASNRRAACGPSSRAWLMALLCFYAAAAPAGVEGTVLWYLQHGAGVEPYQVRYIVTPDYLRSDEGNDEGGFLLFKRTSRQIYNVVPEDESILHIDGKGVVPVAPQHLALEIRRSVDEQAPRIDDRAPVNITLSAGGELCYSAVVVPGFLRMASAAFRDFAQALSVQQQRTLDHTPEEYRTPCFLARYIHAPDFFMGEGVAIAEQDGKGYRSELLRYETGIDLDASLFELPAGLQLYQVQ